MLKKACLPFPVEALKSWFLQSKRDLPWRKLPTPYAVWVSEVMLQQTQVSVVVPYFERWLQRFPTVKDLAEASLEEVIKLWEGLGYYSRARSLHRGAQYIMEHYDGQLPSDREALQKIPGIGPYTLGAILSFAFGQKAAAVDGNVIRVLARFAAREDEAASAKFKKWVWDYAEAILPNAEPWLVVEGVIELGATVCSRQPKCFACPLASSCLGLKLGIADLLPIKKKQALVTQLKRQVAVVRYTEASGIGPEAGTDFFLLRKGKRGSLMADLYEFPYVEGQELAELKAVLASSWQLDISHIEDFPAVQHTFTRYKATLYPSLWQAAKRVVVKGFEWVEGQGLDKLPFSSGHRKIITELKGRYAPITH